MGVWGLEGWGVESCLCGGWRGGGLKGVCVGVGGVGVEGCLCGGWRGGGLKGVCVRVG